MFTRKMLILISLVLAIVGHFVFQYWTSSRLYTPLDAPKAVLYEPFNAESNERLWGSYRSNLYFGLRTRTPESLLFGLLWFAQYPSDGQIKVRHSCEQSDNLPRYGWLQHDGKSFGSQEIVDEDFILTTEYLKRVSGRHGGDWTARVKGEGRFKKDTHQAVSLMFAVANEGKGKLTRIAQGGILKEINGRTPALGEFKIKFVNPIGDVKLQTYLTSYESDIYNAKDAVLRQLKYTSNKRQRKPDPLVGLPGDVVQDGQTANFFVYQVTLRLPFQIDVVFESDSSDIVQNQLSGSEFTREMELRRAAFNQRFEEIFQLKAKNFTDKQVLQAKAAMSNMIGGMGYFYGKSKVQSHLFKEPVDYWETALYTGVPSRSFFPRGFLWDEGFHQMLVQKWDPTITQQSLSHWLDLLNYDGWIPREQILGVEARRKVPDQFVVQRNTNANPPTFFITIEMLIEHEKRVHGDVTPHTLKWLKHVFPRLQAWFKWYNTTQVGGAPGTYMWHGRDAKTDRELNPKTLTSGLDDYPRASHPTADERHVDMYCWIALAAGILADIARLVHVPDQSYRQTEQYLKDNALLDELHWSDKLKSYADYGNHTKHTKLVWVTPRQNHPRQLIRRTKQKPELRFVDEFGYVSIFPLLLTILQPDSPKLETLMKKIRDPAHLWTDYGLRSLSKKASMYNAYNTEHDKPYWRGPIWVNCNFLAVKALKHYHRTPGPYQDLAGDIYTELRGNLVQNILSQYEKTGYVWEQYDDETGKGQGCFPFTGWSGLVTLLMGENF